jgi:hypothetical protein
MSNILYYSKREERWLEASRDENSKLKQQPEHDRNQSKVKQVTPQAKQIIIFLPKK